MTCINFQSIIFDYLNFLLNALTVTCKAGPEYLYDKCCRLTDTGMSSK